MFARKVKKVWSWCHTSLQSCLCSKQNPRSQKATPPVQVKPGLWKSTACELSIGSTWPEGSVLVVCMLLQSIKKVLPAPVDEINAFRIKVTGHGGASVCWPLRIFWASSMFLAWLHGCGGGVIKKLLPLHAEPLPSSSLPVLLSGSISGARCEKEQHRF